MEFKNIKQWSVFKGVTTPKLKLLDLYCCQHVGGYGFEQAGFDVTGVDLFEQPKHPGKFIQADAIEYLLEHGHEYDYIHASPPCQEYSTASMQFRILGKSYPNLIEATRAALIKVGKPYDIENVPNSPLINPVVLCGSMFGIPTYRHRHFETNWGLKQPLHPVHIAKNTKMGRAPKDGEFIQYVGHFSGVKHVQEFTDAHWADQYGLAQSIPPQYTKYIGEQFLEKFTQQHTYATNAPDGSYSADCFGEIVWQLKGTLNNYWVTINENHGSYKLLPVISDESKRQFLPFIDQVKEAESPKFGEWISVKEIESDMSEVAIDSIKELAKKTVKNFKKTGLMSTELCLIALYILEEYSDSAKTLIKGMSNLDSLLSKADLLLKELSTSPPKTL